MGLHEQVTGKPEETCKALHVNITGDLGRVCPEVPSLGPGWHALDQLCVLWGSRASERGQGWGALLVNSKVAKFMNDLLKTEGGCSRFPWKNIVLHFLIRFSEGKCEGQRSCTDAPCGGLSCMGTSATMGLGTRNKCRRLML